MILTFACETIAILALGTAITILLFDLFKNEHDLLDFEDSI